MKKIFLLLIAASAFIFTNAQQKEGRVVYERTAQMQIRMQGMTPEMQQMLPRTRTDKFELVFGNNKSLWKRMEEERPQDDEISGNGMQIRMVGAGADDVSFYNFDEAKSVELRELFDKRFIITDSIRRLNWKLSDETKNILGHVCRKATTQRISTRTQMSMNNGNVERVQVADTSNITVWFTTDIPVSAGPDFQGQLPGLILAADINNGRTVYRALEISPKADIASIKEPVKGKKVTPDEFTKERDKMLEQMQRNNGGRSTFRIN